MGNKFRLIFLDGNDISTYATKATSEKRRLAERMIGNLKKLRAKNAQAFNGGISDEQILWLKQELGAACRTGQRAVVMLHHAVMPKGDRTNLWTDKSLVETIVQFHCAVAIFNGHAHKFNYDFVLSRARQVHVVTFGGMVQSPFQSYAFADFYDDELHVHGLVFGRQIEYHLNLIPHGSVAPSGAGADDDKKKPAPTVVSSSHSFNILKRGGGGRNDDHDDAGDATVMSSSNSGNNNNNNAALLFGGLDLASWLFPALSIAIVIGFLVVSRHQRWRVTSLK